MTICIFFCIIFIGVNGCKNNDIKDTYMVQIDEEWLDHVKQRSEEFGWKFKEKIVSNIYLFEAHQGSDKKVTIQSFKREFEGKVLEVETRECSKLRFVPWFDDSPAPPDFKQWLLTKRLEPKMEITWPYYGMDIQEAWSMRLTGKGIKVAIVDSGVELTHSDLKRNINVKLSRSFTGDDTDNGNATRLHNYPETNVYASHGTKAAGLIGAQFGNGVCSAGVAFNASIISLKIFKLEESSLIPPHEVTFPDDHITQALEYERNRIDIYSCSFGLANMFATSTIHIKAVLKEGITEGRNGKGSIYVFSAGNLGNVYDCNTVPYTNSIYTIAIASVGKNGTRPKYSTPCSSVLASTYGEYSTFMGIKKLNTTTLKNRCDTFSGTSASAALASGIIALILQANKSLTWRDVQHIVVRSSSFERLKYSNKTSKNGNGLTYNPHFGFGLMNATEAILLARSWNTVFEMKRFTASFDRHSSKDAWVWKATFPSSRKCLQHIEHVRVNVAFNLEEYMENRLEITLSSPAETRSILFHPLKRQAESSTIVERQWNFTSVQFWGENPYGTWTLRMKFTDMQFSYNVNKDLCEATLLTLYGTASDTLDKDYATSVATEKNDSENEDCIIGTDVFVLDSDKTKLDDIEDNADITFEDNKPIFMNVVIICFFVVVSVCLLFGCYMHKSGQCLRNKVGAL